MTPSSSTLVRYALVCAAIAFLPIAASAQRPHGIPPGQAKRATQPSGQPPASGPAPADAGPIAGFVDVPARTLAAWLDDASVIAPRQAWMTLSASQWRMPIASGIDAPVIDLAFGVTRRVQASLTLPYYRIRAPESDGGFGDIYLSTKVVLRDPSTGFGVAVTPTLEVLNTAMVNAGSSRLNLVLPVSVERSVGLTRMYGSVGYFSRGSLFGGVAVERMISQRAWITGSLTHAYATGDAGAVEEMGLARRRTDLGGGVAYAVAPTVVAFGSVGRTIAGRDPDSTSLVATGGVSVGLNKN